MASQLSNSIITNANLSISHNIEIYSNVLSNSSQHVGNSPVYAANTSTRQRNDTSPLNDLGSVTEHRARNIQQVEGNATSAALVCPSPDEIVIKGRGRRSLPVKWSPIPIESPQKLAFTPSFIKRSPKKGIIALRSSPRKRLQLSDPVAEELQLTSSRKALLHSSPLSRKRNGTQSPSSKSLSESAYSKLSQKELVNILTYVTKKHPEIKNDIEMLLPKPILKVTEEKLIQIKETIMETLPNSTTDSASFCKVIPHLSAMKQLISEQCQHLESLENWSALLDFVFLSWIYVKETPVWDSEIHQNYARNPCFKILSHHSLVALKHINLEEKDTQYIKSLYQRFEELSFDHQDVQLCVELLQRLRKL